ncbi:DUF5009 domain-containing protein [Flavobacteriaceae bacterium F89]|uniref:DUF5009 domain-containing protein n=1 Tax=Cerina litoralis TaxID=2874477 RepID=A0AAE3JQA1_9FLAO|nr:DUF5009 domain-containing protein [Cerina litoralis]MCG2461639.1 DUF5009 domain-containing protein [Cerina litoralis]
MGAIEKSILTGNRLFSLDFFRGLTMFLLIASDTHLFASLTNPVYQGTILYSIGQQFEHVPWTGLRFYDLIQPFFMFIVGVAIPYSYANRIKRGLTHSQIRKHVFQRSFLLLLLGWAMPCIDAGEIVFFFQNVLAQLSVTYLLAFLIMRKSTSTQIVVSFMLLAITEIIYRGFPIEGFNHPFVANENFGTWLDLQYGGASLDGHWVSFNAIPTTAHTIWGVLTAQLLMSKRAPMRKFKILVIAGLIGLAVGYALSPITPIIKRISTSSFVIVSGGWTILSLAFSYWLIDIKKYKNWTLFFAIVGMNSLFIYLFAQVGGVGFIRHLIQPFSKALFGFMEESAANIWTNLILLFFLWYLCYWLYKKKIFIKI